MAGTKEHERPVPFADSQPPVRPDLEKSGIWWDLLLGRANTDEAVAAREAQTAFLNMCDTEEIAPSAGLTVQELQVTSQPDGNTINIRFIRSDNDEQLPLGQTALPMSPLRSMGLQLSATTKTNSCVPPVAGSSASGNCISHFERRHPGDRKRIH
jgi:hypothetical protein